MATILPAPPGGLSSPDRQLSSIDARVAESKQEPESPHVKLTAAVQALTDLESSLDQLLEDNQRIDQSCQQNETRDRELIEEIREAENKRRIVQRTRDNLGAASLEGRENASKAATEIENQKIVVQLLEDQAIKAADEAKVIATRQASILDLDPAEVEKLQAYVKDHPDFADRIRRTAEGTATKEEITEIKGVIFDIQTNNSRSEFQSLMSTIFPPASGNASSLTAESNSSAVSLASSKKTRASTRLAKKSTSPKQPSVLVLKLATTSNKRKPPGVSYKNMLDPTAENFSEVDGEFDEFDFDSSGDVADSQNSAKMNEQNDDDEPSEDDTPRSIKRSRFV